MLGTRKNVKSYHRVFCPVMGLKAHFRNGQADVSDEHLLSTGHSHMAPPASNESDFPCIGPATTFSAADSRQ